MFIDRPRRGAGGDAPGKDIDMLVVSDSNYYS